MFVRSWRRIQRNNNNLLLLLKCEDQSRNLQHVARLVSTRSGTFPRPFPSHERGFSTKANTNFTESLKQHVMKVIKEHQELSQQLVSSESSRLSHSEFRKISKLVAGMTPVIESAKKMEQKEEELQELDMMSKEGGELGELALQEKEICKQRIQEIQDEILKSLIPRDVDDGNSAILEIRAGTGGLEASHFAEEIFQMYQKYCLYKGWKFEILNITAGNDKVGCKSASACITGSGVYGEMKQESGVHRVQRVPSTDSSGRIHTSTISAVVLPQPEEMDITINPADLKIETFRASGAGGQHVNCTDSAIRITHIPTKVVVACQEGRSQHMNREKAMKVLKAKLYDTQYEQVTNDRSSARSQQIGSAERSEKIRTYNYQQGRITDHRIGVTLHGVEEFLQGGQPLEELISQLKTSRETEALELLLNSNATS